MGKAGIALFFFSASGFKALYAWLPKYIKTNLNRRFKHRCAQQTRKDAGIQNIWSHFILNRTQSSKSINIMVYIAFYGHRQNIS